MEKINKPSIIIDVVEQFEANKSYRVLIKGISNLRQYLSNQHSRKAFYKGKLQIVFRPTQKDFFNEIENVVEMLFLEHKDIFILFDEMETYADRYLTKSSNIYTLFYKSRNRNIDLICVIKQIRNLSDLVRDATDLFFLGNVKSVSAKKYFNERSDNRYKNEIKSLNFREFLVTDLDSYWGRIQLRKTIVNIIN